MAYRGLTVDHRENGVDLGAGQEPGALLVLVLAAAFTLVIVVMFSPAGPILANYFSVTWHTFATWFTGLFT